MTQLDQRGRQLRWDQKALGALGSQGVHQVPAIHQNLSLPRDREETHGDSHFLKAAIKGLFNFP